MNTFLSKRGLLRLKSIIGPDGPIPVSRSTWYAGVRSGRFPKGIALGPRCTAWRVADIELLVEKGVVVDSKLKRTATPDRASNDMDNLVGLLSK